MREEEGGRRDMERGIFDRAIDLGLDWDWPGVGEQASTCSAALQRIGGDRNGNGNGSHGGPSGSPSSPNVPNPEPQTAALSGAGQGVPVLPGIVSSVHRRNWNRRRDGGMGPCCRPPWLCSPRIRLNGASTRVVDSCRRMTGLPTFLCMYSGQKTGFIIGQGRQAEYILPISEALVRCRACAFVAVITAWHG